MGNCTEEKCVLFRECLAEYGEMQDFFLAEALSAVVVQHAGSSGVESVLLSSALCVKAGACVCPVPGLTAPVSLRYHRFVCS